MLDLVEIKHALDTETGDGAVYIFAQMLRSSVAEIERLRTAIDEGLFHLAEPSNIDDAVMVLRIGLWNKENSYYDKGDL